MGSHLAEQHRRLWPLDCLCQPLQQLPQQQVPHLQTHRRVPQHQRSSVQMCVRQMQGRGEAAVPWAMLKTMSPADLEGAAPHPAVRLQTVSSRLSQTAVTSFRASGDQDQMLGKYPCRQALKLQCSLRERMLTKHLL